MTGVVVLFHHLSALFADIAKDRLAYPCKFYQYVLRKASSEEALLL